MTNLSLVWMMPVVHLDLQITTQIFEIFENDPKVIFRAWGKMIHEKP
jgi:hypothetical protein